MQLDFDRNPSWAQQLSRTLWNRPDLLTEGDFFKHVYFYLFKSVKTESHSPKYPHLWENNEYVGN